MCNTGVWEQQHNKGWPFHQGLIWTIPFYTNPTGSYLTQTCILLVVLSITFPHPTPFFHADCNQLSCPSAWLFAFNHSMSPHLFYTLAAKNTTWILLSILCTDAALIYMRKKEIIDIKKIDISICLSLFTVMAVPLDQTWFSPLQT